MVETIKLKIFPCTNINGCNYVKVDCDAAYITSRTQLNVNYQEHKSRKIIPIDKTTAKCPVEVGDTLVVSYPDNDKRRIERYEILGTFENDGLLGQLTSVIEIDCYHEDN